MSEQETPAPANWERDVLEKLALSAIQEQRRSRHWSILFKTLGFLYLFIVLFLAVGWFGSDGVSIKQHTALIDLQGVIAADETSADSIISSLQGAFEDKKTQGVILRINSPGGSPVQAGQIYDEIRRLRALHP
jgi:protease-4